MSKWWKIFPWKFGKGSIRRGCPVKPLAGVPTPRWLWGSAWALVFYCLCRSSGGCKMSMRNLFAKSIFCSGWWDPLSSFRLKVEAAYLQPVSTPCLGPWTAFHLHTMISLAYVCLLLFSLSSLLTTSQGRGIKLPWPQHWICASSFQVTAYSPRRNRFLSTETVPGEWESKLVMWHDAR